MKNKNIGSDFDDFLMDEGMLEEVTAVAVKRVIAWQIEQEMLAQKMTKTAMLHQLYVRPTCLRQGIGRTLVGGHLAQARQGAHRHLVGLEFIQNFVTPLARHTGHGQATGGLAGPAADSHRCHLGGREAPRAHCAGFDGARGAGARRSQTRHRARARARRQHARHARGAPGPSRRGRRGRRAAAVVDRHSGRWRRLHRHLPAGGERAARRPKGHDVLVAGADVSAALSARVTR